MKTAKSQNIPDFQRDFTEIFETVLRSENFACHFDNNTEDILEELPHDGISKQVLSVLHQNKF
jgi:hypothetical protein